MKKLNKKAFGFKAKRYKLTCPVKTYNLESVHNATWTYIVIDSHCYFFNGYVKAGSDFRAKIGVHGRWYFIKHEDDADAFGACVCQTPALRQLAEHLFERGV